MAHQERVNIAVFIDFDNIEIGVRTTLGEHFDVGIVLEALKERGEVVTKIAYADWTRAGEYSRHLSQHAIRLVQRNLTPGGDKNGADINLALDALEMAFTHTHINAYVIVGGDSDFLSLVEKLKQYDKKVFVIGGRAFTSVILQKNCHEFIAYENLVRTKPVAVRGGRPPAPTMASTPFAQSFPIVRRALKILADREVSPQTGLLKSTLLQLDSTFSERSYGATSFLDFAEKLQQAGLVLLKHAGRSVMVELNPEFADDASDQTAPKVRTAVDGDVDVPQQEGMVSAPTATPPSSEMMGSARPVGSGASGTPGVPGVVEEPLTRLGENADGVRAAGQLIAGATGARWPMYLRNVKQILRAASFDERRYGFGGLLDLLKACQREGLVRIERDRRGGLRVFQGSAMARVPASSESVSAEPVINGGDAEEAGDAGDIGNIGNVIIDAQPDSESGEGDMLESQSVSVVDTTAELLGRAKHKRPRVRPTASTLAGATSPSTPSARGGRTAAGTRAATDARKTAAKKPAAPAKRRTKKTNSEAS